MTAAGPSISGEWVISPGSVTGQASPERNIVCSADRIVLLLDQSAQTFTGRILVGSYSCTDEVATIGMENWQVENGSVSSDSISFVLAGPAGDRVSYRGEFIDPERVDGRRFWRHPTAEFGTVAMEGFFRMLFDKR